MKTPSCASWQGSVGLKDLRAFPCFSLTFATQKHPKSWERIAHCETVAFCYCTRKNLVLQGDEGILIIGKWSERRDLNPRPFAPEANALPDCATLRHRLHASRKSIDPVRQKQNKAQYIIWRLRSQDIRLIFFSTVIFRSKCKNGLRLLLKFIAANSAGLLLTNAERLDGNRLLRLRIEFYHGPFERGWAFGHREA